MDGCSQSALEVTYGPGADSGSLGQPLLRQPDRLAQTLEGHAKTLIHVTRFGDPNGE